MKGRGGKREGWIPARANSKTLVLPPHVEIVNLRPSFYHNIVGLSIKSVTAQFEGKARKSAGLLMRNYLARCWAVTYIRLVQGLTLCREE